MKLEQLELNYASPTLSSVKVGECFTKVNVLAAPACFMRIAPVKSLLHSTLIHEVLARGDVFAVDLTTGMFTVLPASTLVVPLHSRFQYQFK